MFFQCQLSPGDSWPAEVTVSLEVASTSGNRYAQGSGQSSVSFTNGLPATLHVSADATAAVCYSASSIELRFVVETDQPGIVNLQALASDGVECTSIDPLSFDGAHNEGMALNWRWDACIGRAL